MTLADLLKDLSVVDITRNPGKPEEGGDTFTLHLESATSDMLAGMVTIAESTYHELDLSDTWHAKGQPWTVSN